MTITVNIGEADLADILARVEAGEEVILARDDVPVARMLPVEGDAQARAKAMEAILAFRETMPQITPDEITEWKQIGRR
ncbi:MAG: type II toxin-antitoxin system prevent-host-death family antitoxin [Neorhizobium sp.]|nr:type II toxin-antitoxin system prevent-host-death family antitoxin [Neorhizobium sp.]